MSLEEYPEEQKDFVVKEERRKIIKTEFLKLSIWTWLFILGFFALMFYFSYDTRLVPNTVVVQTIDPVTNLIINQTKVLYPPNSFVPNSNFSNTEFFLLAIYGAALIFFLITKNVKQKRLLRLDEVMEIADKYMKFLRDKWKHKSVREYNIGPAAKLKNRAIGATNEPKPWEWLISADIRSIEDYDEYYIIGVHPYEGYITRFLKVDHRLKQIDCCPRCGLEHDVKIYTPEEFAKMLSMAKGRKLD